MDKRSKKTYMRDETFAELVKSAKQALAYERGAREGYRVTPVAVPKPPPPMSNGKIARVRKRLNYS